MSQGRNPWSDLGSLEALRLCGAFLERAVRDATDDEAREKMIWAATLAGLAFGNAGVHLPHAMAYAVAGVAFHQSHQPNPSAAGRFTMAGYPDAPLVPHGISVVTSAPAAFRFTARACPDRHLAAAGALGEHVAGARADDAASVVSAALTRLMRASSVPIDLAALGYTDADRPALVRGTSAQRRLLDNAPCPVDDGALDRVFRDAVGSPAASH
jgi:alcohol dehydrogenase class IV